MSQSCSPAFRAKAAWCGYLLAFFGAIAAYFASARAWERMEIAKTYEHAEGVVIGQEVRQRMVRSARMLVRRDYFHPIVEYRTDHGTYTITGEVASEEPLYSEGQTVPVLYPASHPSRGLIADFSEMYFVATFLGAGALLLFLGAGVALVVPRMMDDPLALPPAEANDPALALRP
jgi:Protein of unknown function (DUF3592)